MSRVDRLAPVFVESIPRAIEEGFLYISEVYETASHKCPCGCGNRVVTPLTPNDWQLTKKGDRVTLYPSVGNWNFPCRSHYWVRSNEIVWASSWTDAEIAAGRALDQKRKAAFYTEHRPNIFARVWSWIKNRISE